MRGIVEVTTRHEEFRLRMVSVLREFGDLTAVELLALSSAFVGQIIALQDQNTMDHRRAMNIVATNIELGNKAVIAQMMGPAAGNG